MAGAIEVVGATVACSARSAGGMGWEGFLDRCGYLLGDAELVDHARDDQAAAVDVERGGVRVLV